ncbi:MAG TPA: AAA family ATPase, partial [Cellulomonadaceae bacterium]|nr:AAA family ATPase [Cellulomonadaceae bacterium]
MKIIELTAENVKRLRAVDITPAAHVQVIAGRNAQGKSSVMDAIWLALGGGTASKATTRPIRDGQTTASVRLDLGDLIVTRTWVGDKTTLTVTSAEGARYGSPQKMLDDLVGRLSFDPLAFTHLAPREQRDTLLTLVDLPFDPAHLDRRRAGLYDERTEIGRQGKQLEGQLA